VFKKIGKFIKRGFKKVGKFLKRGFKSIGKFVGKLGPIGMLGMMIIMPQLSAWWTQFGEWAGALQGPLGKVMNAAYEAGSKIGQAYSTVTETITGGLKKIPGVGEAYEGLENYIGGKLDDVRGALGLEQSSAAVASSSSSAKEVDIETDLSSKKKIMRSDNTSILDKGGNQDFTKLNQDGTLKLDSNDRFRNMMADTRGAGIGDQPYTGFNYSNDNMFSGNDNMFGAETNFLEDTAGIIPPPNKVGDKWYDKAADFYKGAQAVRGTLEELGLGGEEEQAQFGGTYVADSMVGLYGQHEAAKQDYTAQGYLGKPIYGIGDPNYYLALAQQLDQGTTAYQRTKPS
jgi:hypothetical protein